MTGADESVDGKDVHVPFVAIVGNIGWIEEDTVYAGVVTGPITWKSLRGHAQCGSNCEKQEYDLSHNMLLVVVMSIAEQ